LLLPVEELFAGGPAGMRLFDLRSESTKFRMKDDFLDNGLMRQAASFLGALLLGQVSAGDLEAVKEQARAARVEVICGDGMEDETDGGLNGDAILRGWQSEDTTAGFTLTQVGGGFTGGVMVVAEVFIAQARAAAAVAVGEDVAALVAFGCFGRDVVHGSLLVGCFA